MNETIGLIGGRSSGTLAKELKTQGFEVAAVVGNNKELNNEKIAYCLTIDLKEQDKIIRFFKRLKIKKILIGTGHILAITLLKRLNEAGFLTNLDYEICMFLKNKIRLKKKIISLGYKTPDYSTITTSQEAEKKSDFITYPSVVKSHIDSVPVCKVHNKKEYLIAVHRVLETGATALIEKFIQGIDCTVPVYTLEKKKKDLGVIYFNKANEWNLPGFSYTKNKELSLIQENRIRTISKELVKTLNIPSLVRVDFIVRGAVSYILEINEVIVTRSDAPMRPYFDKKKIDPAKIMVETVLNHFEEYSKNIAPELL